MHKIFHKIFSKSFFLVFFVLLQFALIIFLCLNIYNLGGWIWVACEVLGVLAAIYIINSHSENSYKLTWIFLILLVPLFGFICYLIFANKKFSRRKKAKMKKLIEDYKVALNSGGFESCIDDLNNDIDSDAYGIAKYIEENSFIKISKNTKVTYYKWGEEAFPVMLEKLKTAKHYIFLEYFIIHLGKMWSSILNILIEKIKEGVDVRIIYDDFGCLKTLPENYDKRLKKLGFKVIRASKLRPLLDVKMNNRDHRKILVIDGYVGFTGGINLADEYINEIERFGKWKDNAIMIEGDGVYGLTSLFLSHFIQFSKFKENLMLSDYLPHKYINESSAIIPTSGYVQAYGSIPVMDYSIGEDVYINLCLKAKKYIYITTPYLILGETMLSALCIAAKNGVKVKIITPHIPDKKRTFQLTRSYYGALLRLGVEIYEYLPGFVHAKTFVVDGVIATVGTINLDYRSLYLHYENGVFLYKCNAIKDIENDMLTTLKDCMNFNSEVYLRTKWSTHLYRSLLRIVAPLF